MTSRSTSMPRIAVGAGVMAAAALIPVADKGAFVSSVGSMAADNAACATNWKRGGLEAAGDTIVGSSLSFPVEEEWSEEKHKTELRKLIVKKATSKTGLSTKDASRLAMLQRMRRESMPLATSYETFIRERERLAELKRLTDALMEYERKYGHASNG